MTERLRQALSSPTDCGLFRFRMSGFNRPWATERVVYVEGNLVVTRGPVPDYYHVRVQPRDGYLVSDEPVEHVRTEETK